jgi:hypothetical protein
VHEKVVWLLTSQGVVGDELDWRKRGFPPPDSRCLFDHLIGAASGHFQGLADRAVLAVLGAATSMRIGALRWSRIRRKCLDEAHNAALATEAARANPGDGRPRSEKRPAGRDRPQ